MMRGTGLAPWLALALSLLAAACAQAQTVRAQGPRGEYRPPAYVPRQPPNVMARDTTPMNCEQFRSHPHPRMVAFCEGIERSLVQMDARLQGRPAPSGSVIELPPLGSPEARQLGYACVGGQAMRRLEDGWEQVMARDRGWQRCRGG